MIRNDREYRNTLDQIEDFTRQIEAMTDKLKRMGIGHDDIAVATAATRQLLNELIWERDFHDRLKSEGLGAVPNYSPEERGKALIAIRIARGKSQKELADTLSVSQAQVSRDENNDYHGITNERYARILAALGVEEHIAGYKPREPYIIQMPTVNRQAASFIPDYDNRFSITT